MKRSLFGLLLLVTLLCILSSGQAPAIPRDVKAKSEFYLAVEKFEAKNYTEAVEHLENARLLLGETNGNIQFYLVKSHWNLKKYDKAMEELEKFFDVAKDEEKNSEPYNEMVVLLSKVEEQLKVEAKKAREEEIKKANAEEARSRAFGDRRISLEEAKANGIPCPPLNVLPGKKWVIQTSDQVTVSEPTGTTHSGSNQLFEP